MSLTQPPIQEVTSSPENGMFPQVWIRWLSDLYNYVIRANYSTISIPAITSSTTLGNANSTVLCDATSGIFTVTLPDVALFLGYKYKIKKIDTSGNDVTISGGGVNIDGASTAVLSGSSYPSYTIQSDGTQWWTL